MILPTKHVALDHSLLGAGAALLGRLVKPMTTTGLWEASKHDGEIRTYARFILTLDFLYAIGALDFDDGLLVRNGTL